MISTAYTKDSNAAVTPLQQSAQHQDRDLERALAEAVEAQAPGTRPPASAAAGAAGEKWGLHDMRVTSPLQLLAQVADNTSKLQVLLDGLVRDLTGEGPAPKRVRLDPGKVGLLPAISMLAHQINEAHTDLAKVILHLRKRLGG